jgi:hypothetical protein
VRGQQVAGGHRLCDVDDLLVGTASVGSEHLERASSSSLRSTGHKGIPKGRADVHSSALPLWAAQS